MSRSTFEEYVAHVRAGVDAWLVAWLDGKVAEARTRGGPVEAVAGALRELALRGGKRMRAALLAVAFEACGGGPAGDVVAAGASLELLQLYLLVHDDWMDGDDVRRGGPSVPAAMRARFPAQHDAASVLAGDLASAWAQQALLESPQVAERVALAARELARVQEEVVSGQVLDVLAGVADARAVEAAYALKTASYSARAPVVMGATLAGAAGSRGQALAAFAMPLGVAFQLRDDLLGTFGDPRVTGKPSGADLRRGKRTWLVLDAMRDARAAAALDRVLGRADASEADLAAAAGAIEACGARRRVEDRVAALVEESRAALARADLGAGGRGLLEGAAAALARRDR